MSPDLVLFATLASCIHILHADCILEMDTPVLIPENAFVCMPVNKSLGETEEYFGRRFLTCMDSEVHMFECDVGKKFDVVTTDCREGPPRCDHNEEIPTIPPSPPTTTQSTTSSLQTTARYTTSSPTPTISASSPTKTTSASSPTPTTSASSPTPTISASAPTPTISASAPYPTTSASSPTPTISASSPTPTTSASSPTPTTSASSPTPTTSASSPTPTISASAPTPTISASAPYPTTSASSPTPTISASSPTPTTSASSPTPTISASSPTPTISASSPTPTTSASSPTPTTSASSTTPTTSASSPTPTISASSPDPTISASSPDPTISAATSPATSSASSSAPTSKSTLAPVETIASNVSTTTGTTTQPVPVVDPSSAVCTADNCKLPNCFCLGAKPPIKVSDSPMIVMLSFDDAVTEAFMVAYYHQLLVENIYSLNNPNNCSIKSTFFLSSADTDYNQVKILYDKGHEFASHTVKHILPDGGTKQEYKDEIVGIRDILVSKALVDGKKVVGFRAPYLKLAGNQMFEVLHEQNFLYDSSISNIERKKGNSHLWPFTLDFPISQSKCPNGPCPSQGFPGLWEVPMNAWLTADDGHCAMIDACIVANFTDDKETVKDKYFRYFQKNFYETFYPEKVPMHIFTHAAVFLKYPGSFEGLTDFLQEINSLPDVWFLTPSQALDWMKQPVTNDDAANGVMSSWNCGGHVTQDGQ